MPPMFRVRDTGSDLNFIRADYLVQSWLENIRHRDMPEIRNASIMKLPVSGTITLYIRMGESRTRQTLIVVEKLTVPVLLESTFIARFIKSIHSDRRKIVPYHSLPISAAMIHEAKSEAKKKL